MTSQTSHFRQDIQGMRGLAVLLVVLEHGTPLFPGGYVGVDVFFVISGFVITEALMREMSERGSVSLSAFYVRRVLRLGPALLSTLVATLGISYFVLGFGQEQRSAAWASIASFAFFANIRYILEGSYFFLAADPLRHMWSLSVEEQFYLIYPGLILLLGLLAKRLEFHRSFVRRAMIVLVALSLASAVVLSLGYRILPLPTRLAFFATPFRFWELLVGGLLAWYKVSEKKRPHPMFANVLAVSAFTAIFLPSLTFDEFTIFPGPGAILPVVGAAGLIYVNRESKIASTLLTQSWLVWVGDISYSLYLIHWPVIVFGQRLFPASAWADVSLVAVSIMLAVAQYKWVEQRYRTPPGSHRRFAVRFMVLGVILIALLSGGLLWFSESMSRSSRTPVFAAPESLSQGCIFDGGDFTNNICGSEESPLAESRVLLVGDSQAAALTDGFVAAADNLGLAYKMAYANSCPIFPRPNEIRTLCPAFLEGVSALIKEWKPSVIVVSNASDLYVSRGGFGRPDTRIRDRDGQLPTNYQGALATWLEGLSEQFSGEWRMGARIIYVQMVPVAVVPERSVIASSPRRQFSLSAGFDRNYVVSQEKLVLADLAGVEVIDPAGALCKRENCRLVGTAGPLYSDKYHLNSEGAMTLVSQLESALRQSLG